MSYAPRDWAGLVADGALVNTRVSMAEAHDALAAGRNPPEPGEGAFLDLWVGLIDPATVGRNLLGQQAFSRAIGSLGLSDAALFVGSAGLQSHRGTAWRRSGVFDRMAVRQGDLVLTLTEEDYLRLDDLEIAGAPDLKERSIFRLAGEGFDPTAPFIVDVTATRHSDGEPVTMVISRDFALPQQFRQVSAAPDLPPLRQSTWETKQFEVASVGVMLGALMLILLFQENLTRRRRLYRAVRLGFLTVTLVWLGWVLNGQLSVAQVVAFLHALLLGFRWETFLIEPIIFTLWGFVALGLLFWGRGVFCGWLCPFGALQELTNVGAKLLRVPQVVVPQALHERLWIIKYTLFIAIVALSFYSMEWALKLAEAEPFKTAVSMRMMRAWPFMVFVVALLLAGLFIERFYCRYLCPLGAGLAIPAKLKIFDWLHRRPQCGRECHLCEQKCTVGAIDPLGRINPNECILCLKCQWIFHDDAECTILKKRARARAGAAS